MEKKTTLEELQKQIKEQNLYTSKTNDNAGESRAYYHINNGGVSFYIGLNETNVCGKIEKNAIFNMHAGHFGCTTNSMSLEMTPNSLILFGEWLIREGELLKQDELVKNYQGHLDTTDIEITKNKKE